jgi:hypothetical protein
MQSLWDPVWEALRQGRCMRGRHQDDRSWWLRHVPEAVRRLWPVLREGRATVSEVLGELFGGDEAIKLTLATNLGYYHDDPDRMLFLRYAIPQASYLMEAGTIYAVARRRSAIAWWP